MKKTEFKTEIANHLKSKRKRRKLSLDGTAKLTGVSKAMLGQIERGESSPTIATLWKIASGLDTSFSAFFTSNPNFKLGERIFPKDPRMKIKTLFPYSEDTSIEVFEITLSDYHEQMSSPHSVGVIEHVHVIRGEISIYFDNKWHSLKTGESLRFFSDQHHGYRSVSETSVFHNIVSYPQ